MNKKLLTMGLAALLMAGCSSDDLVGGEGDKGGASAVKGYVGLTITMPTGAGSRAVEYDDGAAGEYKVNDVTLVFSKWNTLSNKHDIVQVTKLTSTDWQKETGSDDITSFSLLPVVPVADKDADRVLVLVNSTGAFAVESSTINENTGVISGKGFIAPKGGVQANAYSTIEALEEVQTITGGSGSTDHVLNDYYGTTTGWFMTSASIKNATNIDGNDDHKQLVKITPQSSKEAAMADAGKNVIYVERAVAKVSLTFIDAQETTKKFSLGSGTGFAGDEVTIDGWALDITNKSTFPLRRINTSWPDLDRFAPAPAVGRPQRYEWSEDNNYSSYNLGTDFYRTNATEVNANRCNISLYCLENTFSIANMKQDGTTRAILRGQYVPNGITQTEVNDHGIFRLGESVKFYKQADMLAKVKAAVVASGAVTEAEMNTAAVSIDGLKVGKADFTYNGAQNKIVVIKQGEATPVDLSGVIDDIKGMLGQLTYYANGYCYYPVRIRHFADDTDPYANGVSAWTAGDTYDTDAKWLGRYGVVRNNSYVINVTGVSAPGSPTIPDPTQNIDDEQFYYIQATVKVLSWTKRSQDVEL